MQQCCVLGCRNIGNHSFPRDKKLRKQWEIVTRCKNSTTKHTKICSQHFKPDDFRQEGYQTGLQITNRLLNRAAVPSIFPWSKDIDFKLIDAKKEINPKFKKCAKSTSTSTSSVITSDFLDIENTLDSDSQDSDTLILIKTDSLLPVYYNDLLNTTIGNSFNPKSQDRSTLVLVQPGNICELCNRNCGLV